MSNSNLDPLTGLPIDDDSIKALSDLAGMQIELEEEIETLETQLKSRKERHRKISQEIIPTKLEELGLSEIKTANGRKVTIKKFYSNKIISHDAFKWLDENGHGGVIKTLVTKPFARDEREEAIAFAKEHEKEGFVFNESVHHATLAALTRELDEAEVEMPADLFSVFKGKKTVIK